MRDNKNNRVFTVGIFYVGLYFNDACRPRSNPHPHLPIHTKHTTHTTHTSIALNIMNIVNVTFIALSRRSVLFHCAISTRQSKGHTSKFVKRRPDHPLTPPPKTHYTTDAIHLFLLTFVCVL